MQPCLSRERWWRVGKEPVKAGFEVLMVLCGQDPPRLLCFPHGSLTDGGGKDLQGCRAAVLKARRVAGSVSFLVALSHPSLCPVAYSLAWEEGCTPRCLAGLEGDWQGCLSALLASQPAPPCSTGSESACSGTGYFL